MESWRVASDFESDLLSYLKIKGLDVTFDYRIPDTDDYLDFFIANHPKTVIEIWAITEIDNVERLWGHLKEKEFHWKNIPMTDFLFVVVIGEVAENIQRQISEEAGLENVDFIFYPYPLSDGLIHTQTFATEAGSQIIAKREEKNPSKLIKISEIVPHESVTSRGLFIEEDFVESVKENGVINPVLAMLNPDGFYVILDGWRRVMACMELGIDQIPAYQMDIKLGDFWETDDKDVRNTLYPDLKSLLNLIDDENIRTVIDHELTQLCDEFEAEHYTSCGLRVGRLLESLIYGLAISCSVPLRVPRLETLNRIEELTNEIKNIYLDYCDLNDGPEKEQKMVLIKNKMSEISSAMFEITDEIKSTTIEDQEKSTRYTGAITRDVYSKYKQIELVRLIYKENDLNKRVADIMKIRNLAAHANINSHKQELDKEQINNMVEDIRSLITIFSKLIFVIQQHLSKK